MKKIYLVFVLLCLGQFVLAQSSSIIKGVLSDIEDAPIGHVFIYLDGVKLQETTKRDGSFEIKGVSEGTHKITFVNSDSTRQYSETITLGADETKEVQIIMHNKGDIGHITILGKYKQPQGLDMITRLPVNPREMPQNISIISDEIISEQGALTITDAVRNVPGVTLFGTYGGSSESMSIRGYRGTPVLKNGVQIDSDFRTASLTNDMQGVSSIQILRGSAAITQGIGNGLGSPSGVINVVTKVPLFVNAGKVALESGSWGFFRPTLDYQTVLDKKGTAAFRINAAYQRADSYKPRVDNNRIYVNPSFEWRPDDKTRITLQMDYMNDNTTPDRGTVNLADIDENKLYDMSNKFLGWGTDNENTKITTYSARIERKLNDQLSLRALYAGASNEGENIGVSISGSGATRSRSLARSDSEDKNKVIQLDLVGKEIYTGKIKHTFQVGFDYKINEKTSISYKAVPVDQINVLNEISNNLPSTISNSSLKESGRTYAESEVYGLMIQEAMEINKYVRVNLGLRYSQDAKKTNINAANEAWDPFFGFMVTPVKDISIFGNYATTTNLRSASNLTQDGGTVGASVTDQFELGIKSDWFDKRLSFNATYFNINNGDLAYQVYENGVAQPYYEKAGDLKREGIELELTGNILKNLKVIAGYSYTDVGYKNSIAYVNGSRPMNAPYNTANGWVQYLFDQGSLKNLSVGLGVYYVGDRPVNDYSSNLRVDGHGTTPGVKPFNMPEYTTVNMQLGYTYKDIGLQVFLNNIFDELGYTSYYRGGYINQIDPRNFKVQLSYKF